MFVNNDDIIYLQRFSFGLTPRRSLSRLDNHSVRFTGLTTPSTSTTSESKRDSNSLRAEIFKTTSTEESFHSIESTLKLDYCDPELDELEQQLREIDEYTDEEIESKNSKIEETNQIKRPETPKCRRSLRCKLFIKLFRNYKVVFLNFFSNTGSIATKSTFS